MPKPAYSATQMMRVQARADSVVEKKYYAKSALPTAWAMPKALAPGISPAPLEDLIFHGGKIVAQMEFQNVYLGGEASWKASDITSIDAAIKLAMQDRRLNNVMVQYFHDAALTCDTRESFIFDEAKPTCWTSRACRPWSRAYSTMGSLKKRISIARFLIWCCRRERF